MNSTTSQLNQPNPNNSKASEPSFFIKLFASALFTGYVPIMSGTVGSAVGLIFYFIPRFETPFFFGAIILIVLLVGMKASTIMEKRYGHDPSEVTIDEVVGMWISLIFLPKTIAIACIAFFIFRFLDIVKPFPAHKFDRMTGGFGIMMDDVIAGIYTNIILQLVLLIPFFKGFLL